MGHCHLGDEIVDAASIDPWFAASEDTCLLGPTYKRKREIGSALTRCGGHGASSSPCGKGRDRLDFGMPGLAAIGGGFDTKATGRWESYELRGSRTVHGVGDGEILRAAYLARYRQSQIHVEGRPMAHNIIPGSEFCPCS